jgi:lipoprotein-anchoring transpeptidase ErfK/SrfK
MKISNNFYSYALAFLTISAIPAVQSVNASKYMQVQQDSFEKVITPEGNSSPDVLASAPSPLITVLGKIESAKFVIDVTNNVLYNYDELGNAKAAYSIATGRINSKGESRTPKGIRVITHVETSPYRTAPRSAKRWNNPGGAYGPKYIYNKGINPLTGELKDDGIGVHGNNDINSLGKNASKGCIRVDNKVIEQLAAEVKKGQFILIK